MNKTVSKHEPTAGDVAMDLVRCVQQDSFENENFKTFYTNALSDWNQVVRKNINKEYRKVIEDCFDKFKNGTDPNRKREDLYTAASILMSYYTHQIKNSKFLG